VTFPLFSKIDVNGSNAHPLFWWLKKEAKRLLGSESIKWSFTKFLLDRSGRVVRRYAPTDTPEALRADIEKLL
jgi:glutathione peroxidase